MCKHGFLHFACGHKRMSEKLCEVALAADNPVYNRVACPNYVHLARDDARKCGHGGYYCSKAPDGKTIEEAELFLAGLGAETQRLDQTLEREKNMYQHFYAFAQNRGLSEQEQLKYHGFAEAKTRTLQLIAERNQLVAKQQHSVALVAYAQAHADDEPQEVGRNYDGTSIYSVLPVALLKQAAAFSGQAAPGPSTANPFVQTQYPQGTENAQMPQPAMGNLPAPNPMLKPAPTLGQVTAPAYGPKTALVQQQQQLQQQAGIPPAVQVALFGPQRGLAPPAIAPTVEQFHAEKLRRDMEKVQGGARMERGRNILPTSARPLVRGSQMALADLESSTQGAAQDNGAAVKKRKQTAKRDSPKKTEPAGVRRSTRTRNKVVKYKEGSASASEKGSREQSVARSDDYQEPADKTDSSEASFKQVRGVERRLSFALAQEVEDLTETKKSARARPSLGNKIAEYKKRSGFANDAATSSNQVPAGGYGHQGAPHRVQAPLPRGCAPGRQLYGDPGMSGLASNNPTSISRWPNDRNNSYAPLIINPAQTLMRSETPIDMTGGRSEDGSGIVNHPQPVRRRPSDILRPDFVAPPITAAPIEGRPPTRLSNVNQHAFDSIQLMRPGARGYVPANSGSINPSLQNIQQMCPNTGVYRTANTGSFNQNLYNPSGKGNNTFAPYAAHDPNAPAGIGSLNPLPQPRPRVTYPQNFALNEVLARTTQGPSMPRFGGPPTYRQPQPNPSVTIPSYRGPITIPAGSNLFHHHAAQSMAGARPSNPAQCFPPPGPPPSQYAPTPDPSSSGPPQMYHFQANTYNSAATHPSVSNRQDYANMRSAFGATPTLTPNSGPRFEPNLQAASNTDPEKYATPEESPRKRFRLSLPGEAGAPVWPAAWRARQSEDQDDPFAPNEQMGGMSTEQPVSMRMLTSGLQPPAPSRQVGSTDELGQAADAMLGAAGHENEQHSSDPHGGIMLPQMPDNEADQSEGGLQGSTDGAGDVAPASEAEQARGERAADDFLPNDGIEWGDMGEKTD